MSECDDAEVLVPLSLCSQAIPWSWSSQMVAWSGYARALRWVCIVAGKRSTHVRRAYSIWLYAYVRVRRFCQSSSIRAYIRSCRVRWGVTLRERCCRAWGCGGTRCWWGSSRLSGAADAGTEFQGSTVGSCGHALCM